MEQHTEWNPLGGEVIETDLMEKLERTLKDFGYELWIAFHDPKSGTRELRFGQTTYHNVGDQRYCRLLFFPHTPLNVRARRKKSRSGIHP